MDRDIRWSEDFDRQLKRLARKYRRIFEDIDTFLDDFSGGHLPGKPFQGIHGLPVKVHRMRDSSSNRGKSSGFRIAYYYDDCIILLAYIVPRSTPDQLSSSRILQILRNEGLYSE